MAYGGFKDGQVLAIDVHLFRQNPWTFDISSTVLGREFDFLTRTTAANCHRASDRQQGARSCGALGRGV
jgi:hypothetical protein